MKSTYKLIGQFLDHGELPAAQPIFVQNPQETIRKINISMLLSLSESEIIQLKNDTKIIQIMVDYVPIASSKVIEDFYTKRVLQIVEKLQLLGISSVFSSDKVNVNNLAFLESIVCNMYKKESS